MKKQVLLIGIIWVVVTGVFAQDSGEFTIPLTDPSKRGRLKVDIHYGAVKVKGSPRKDVLVRYSGDDASDNGKKSGDADGLKRISGGTLDLEGSEKANVVILESSSWNKKTNVEIEVPSGFDIKVSSYNDGDIYIQNVQGEVEITTYNGEIIAENISGSVVATTYNGDVRVTFDKVSSVPMSYATYNGDIDITFPAAVKASLKMKTQQGEILSAFDMTVMKSEPVQKKDSGNGSFKIILDEWVKADIGGGGPEISMRNYNGDIKIRKKG